MRAGWGLLGRPLCTGEERCRPGESGADARGCLTLAAPCAADACDEATDMCGGCIDMDGDGHESDMCGGDDCQDGDALSFPGNPEICDLMNHDEDCDPTTFGMDSDGDGEELATCCNGASCGTDCLDDLDLGAVGRGPCDHADLEPIARPNRDAEATVTGAAQCPMP